MAQIVGLLVFLAGLFLLVGLAWTLVVGGVVIVAFGVALELGVPGARRPDAQGGDA